MRLRRWGGVRLPTAADSAADSAAAAATAAVAASAAHFTSANLAPAVAPAAHLPAGRSEKRAAPTAAAANASTAFVTSACAAATSAAAAEHSAPAAKCPVSRAAVHGGAHPPHGRLGVLLAAHHSLLFDVHPGRLRHVHDALRRRNRRLAARRLRL